MLKRALESLYSKCSKPEAIEVILRIDEDDLETIDFVKTLSYSNLKTIIGDRLGGYASIHLFTNEMCKIAQGKLIFCYSDDSEMLTDNWDNYLYPYLNTICILKLQHVFNHNLSSLIYLVVNRKVFEILGHLSLNAHTDTWMEMIGPRSGIYGVVNDISVRHYVAIGDQTEMDTNSHKGTTSPNFWSTEMGQERENDINKLVNYIKLYGKNIKD